MIGRAPRLLSLIAATAITTSLVSGPAQADTGFAVTQGASVRTVDLGAVVAADFSVSPARYAPGTRLTVAVTGALTIVAERDVVCHSLDTRVLAGRVEIGGSLDATDRTEQLAGESHTQPIAVDVDVLAPDRGNLTARVVLQCSPIDASGNWSMLDAKSAVIWTARIQPTSSGLTVTPEVVFPDADEFTSQARITASAARGPITVTVTFGGRQVWSIRSAKPRVSATVPSSRLTRSGTYTVSVKGGGTARFVVHAGWAPLYDASIAHWPKCSTISWRYDGSGAPRAGDSSMLEDLRTAFARYAKITGLRFVEGGEDIVVSWADLPRGTNAEAGAGRVDANLSSGFLRLSRSADRPRVPGFGGSGRGVTLLHEIGHVLGLGHVTDRAQLMYPIHTDGRSPLTPQRGDIAGLKELYGPATCR